MKTILFRLPWYLVQILWRIPTGLARLAAGINAWRIDTAGEDAYRATADAKPGDRLKLHEERRQQRRSRTAALIFSVALLAGAALASDLLFGEDVTNTAGLVAAGLLLAVALAAGKPLRKRSAITNATEQAPAKRAPITTDFVTEALSAALPEIARAVREDPDAIHYPDPAIRQGNGWTIRAELPAGITAASVVAQQTRLASALRRPTLAVAIEPDPAHAGMVSMWIGDKAPTGAIAWPYSSRPEPVDILQPFPIGEDVRGRPVSITLRNQNALIGAMTGYGKTATLRTILLAAALDSRTRIYAYEFKGSDLLPLESVAERIVCGDEPEDFAQLRDDLREIKKAISARNKMIRALPVDDRPDGEITSADATRLGIAPIIVAIDEAHLAYASETYGKEIAALTEDIFRRGRSVGIHVLLATQRFDKASVPTAISAMASLRMCGRTESFQDSNMILGANAHGAGISGTTLGDGTEGVVWMKGQGSPRIVRIARVTAREARTIVTWAAGQRAPGERPRLELVPDPEPSVIDDIRRIWPEGADRASCAHLAETLAGEGNGYTGWGAADVTAALKENGIPTRVAKVEGRALKAVFWDDLDPSEALG